MELFRKRAGFATLPLAEAKTNDRGLRATLTSEVSITKEAVGRDDKLREDNAEGSPVPD